MRNIQQDITFQDLIIDNSLEGLTDTSTQAEIKSTTESTIEKKIEQWELDNLDGKNAKYLFIRVIDTLSNKQDEEMIDNQDDAAVELKKIGGTSSQDGTDSSRTTSDSNDGDVAIDMGTPIRFYFAVRNNVEDPIEDYTDNKDLWKLFPRLWHLNDFLGQIEGRKRDPNLVEGYQPLNQICPAHVKVYKNLFRDTEKTVDIKLDEVIQRCFDPQLASLGRTCLFTVSVGLGVFSWFPELFYYKFSADGGAKAWQIMSRSMLSPALYQSFHFKFKLSPKQAKYTSYTSNGFDLIANVAAVDPWDEGLAGTQVVLRNGSLYRNRQLPSKSDLGWIEWGLVRAFTVLFVLSAWTTGGLAEAKSGNEILTGSIVETFGNKLVMTADVVIPALVYYYMLAWGDSSAGIESVYKSVKSSIKGTALLLWKYLGSPTHMPADSYNWLKNNVSDIRTGKVPALRFAEDTLFACAAILQRAFGFAYIMDEFLPWLFPTQTFASITQKPVIRPELVLLLTIAHWGGFSIGGLDALFTRIGATFRRDKVFTLPYKLGGIKKKITINLLDITPAQRARKLNELTFLQEAYHLYPGRIVALMLSLAWGYTLSSATIYPSIEENDVVMNNFPLEMTSKMVSWLPFMLPVLALHWKASDRRVLTDLIAKEQAKEKFDAIRLGREDRVHSDEYGMVTTATASVINLGANMLSRAVLLIPFVLQVMVQYLPVLVLVDQNCDYKNDDCEYNPQAAMFSAIVGFMVGIILLKFMQPKIEANLSKWGTRASRLGSWGNEKAGDPVGLVCSLFRVCKPQPYERVPGGDDTSLDLSDIDLDLDSENSAAAPQVGNVGGGSNVSVSDSSSNSGAGGCWGIFDASDDIDYTQLETLDQDDLQEFGV